MIVYNTSWADAVPERLKNLFVTSRLINNLIPDQKGMATYPEVCAYLMTMNLCGPISNDWAEIYFHVSCTVCQENWNEDHWEDIGAQRVLSEYHAGLLNKLRRSIYETQMKHCKLSKPVQDKPAPAVSLQLSLF